MKTIALAQAVQKNEERRTETYKAFGVTILRKSDEELAAIRLVEIVRAAESCRASCVAHLQTMEENSAYSVSFNDGEKRTSRKVLEEAKWFYDHIIPLFDLILEDNDNAPG